LRQTAQWSLLVFNKVEVVYMDSQE